MVWRKLRDPSGVDGFYRFLPLPSYVSAAVQAFQIAAKSMEACAVKWLHSMFYRCRKPHSLHVAQIICCLTGYLWFSGSLLYFIATTETNNTDLMTDIEKQKTILTSPMGNGSW